MYSVGDRVLIVGVEDCRFGMNEEMRDMIGSVVTIGRVAKDSGEASYKLIEDPGGWTWDDSCFVLAEVVELPIFDLSDMNIENLFI